MAKTVSRKPVPRRAYEYQHEYGLNLGGKAKRAESGGKKSAPAKAAKLKRPAKTR